MSGTATCPLTSCFSRQRFSSTLSPPHPFFASLGLPLLSHQQVTRKVGQFKRQPAPRRAPLLPAGGQPLLMLCSFHLARSPGRARSTKPAFPSPSSPRPSPPRPLHSPHPSGRPRRNHRSLHDGHGRRLPHQEGKVQEVEGAPALWSEHPNQG